MTTLLPLSAAPPSRVEALLDAAFGTDRHGRTAYRLRAGLDPVAALSFAACEDGSLVGSIQCWPVALTDRAGRRWPLVLVGPVAVQPHRQQGGIGRQLMGAALAVADEGGHPPQVLVGDPEYYNRFGFTADETGGWQLPGPWEPRRLLLRRIAGAALPADGTLGPG